MKTVISVTTDRQPGGIATALIGYSRALDIAGYRHMVILPDGASVLPALAKEPNIEIKPFSLGWLKFHLLTRFIFCASVRASLSDARAILVHNARLLSSLSRLAPRIFWSIIPASFDILKKQITSCFCLHPHKTGQNALLTSWVLPSSDQPKMVILPHGFLLPAAARKKGDKTR